MNTLTALLHACFQRESVEQDCAVYALTLQHSAHIEVARHPECHSTYQSSLVSAVCIVAKLSTILMNTLTAV